MASNRHLGRIVVLQTLYEYEFRSQLNDPTVSLSEIIMRNMSRYEETIGDKQFVQDLLNGIIEKQVVTTNGARMANITNCTYR